MENSLESILQCTQCGQKLESFHENYRCTRCQKQYKSENGAIFFREESISSSNVSQGQDKIIFALKSFVKKNPKLFHFLNHTLGLYVGKSAKKSIEHLKHGSRIINIGSGAEIIREDIINLDYSYFPGVKIVADAHVLPFRDNSFDAIISESLLEHVLHPEKVVNEMKRILKPGGMVYIVTPFIIGFHSSPNDYYRWTSSGVRELFKDFDEIELGIAVGPTNALTYILREWLALALSFNSKILHQLWTLFFMILFIPINLFDFVLRKFSLSMNIAHLFYYIGKKK